MKLSIIVTVFNERNTIAQAVAEAKAVNVEKEIIIIDNCSTDGTKEILSNLHDRSTRIIYQSKNLGFGASVKKGAELANGDFLYVQYADLEYDIQCVYQMLDLAEKQQLDAVLGSRLYGLDWRLRSLTHILRNRPFYLGTILTTLMINKFYNKHFTDIIGTRFYRTNTFRKLRLASNGISFDFEVISRMCKTRCKINEVPVTYKARGAKQGKKVKAIDIVPAVVTILKLRIFP